MKTLHWSKNNRLFLWLVLLLLVAVLLILIRTEAASHNQNSETSQASQSSVPGYQNASNSALEPAETQNSASPDTSTSQPIPVGSSPGSAPSEIPPSQEPSYPVYCPQYLRFSESTDACPYPPCKPTVPSSQPHTDVVMCVY